MIYSYADYLKIAKVGDVVRAVKGKPNGSCLLRDDGSNTGRVDGVWAGTFWIEGRGCPGIDVYFLELVSPRIPTWDSLSVGDEIKEPNKNIAKVLEVGASGKTFLRSCWGDYERVYGWYLVEQAKKLGWTLVTPEVQEMTVEEVSKLVGKKVKIVE